MKNLFTLVLLISINSCFGQINWNTPIDVAPSNYGYNNPKVVLDINGDPVVSWGDTDQNLLVSNWNGASFNTPVEVNDTLDVLQSTNFGGEITAIGDTIYAVFKEYPETTGKIWVTKSIDGGSTFGTPVVVDNTGGVYSEYVQITTEPSGNPIVAFNQFDSSWTNPRWAVSRSDDFGASFNSDVQANGWSGGSQIVCECCPAGIASDGVNTILAYRDNLSNLREIWAGLSTDGGSSFTSGMNVDQSGWTINSCPSTGPDIEIVGDTLYTSFMSAGSGGGRVYLSKSSISNGTGAQAEMITGNFGGLSIQNYPRLSIDNGKGIQVWEQTASAQIQIAYSFSNNINTGFPSAYSVLTLNGNLPDVIMQGDEIHVVWRDSQSGTVKYTKGMLSQAGLQSITQGKKEVTKVLDMMGRETTFKNGTPLILMYNDGSVERVYSIEEK